MRLLLSTLLLVVFWAHSLFAQQNNGADVASPFDSIAAKTAVIRIVDKKMGIQNVLGEWLIEPKYDWIQTDDALRHTPPVIRNGMVKVRDNGKYGIVDLHRHTIVPCIYSEIFQVNDGFSAKIAGKEIHLDLSGKELSVAKETFETSPDGYMTRNEKDFYGNVLFRVSKVPYVITFDRESEGFTMVMFHAYEQDHADGGLSDGVYGFLDSRGKWIVEPRLPMSTDFYAFDKDVYRFHSGRALVKSGKDIYYIDTTGRKVFSLDTLLKATEAYPFTEFGYAPVVYYKSNVQKVVWYNLDGSLRFRTTDNLVTGATAAWSPFDNYLHYLPLLDIQANQYILMDDQLKNERYRFSITDSLSTWPKNADALTMTKDFLFLKRVSKDTCNKIQTKIISPDGILVHDWFGLDQAYDPYTEIYILNENRGVRLMQRGTGKVMFECDSCSCSYSSDYKYGFLPGSAGLYTFYSFKKSGPQNFQVNYRGQVFTDALYQPGNNPPKPYYFGNDLQPVPAKKKTLCQYNQAYFDQQYKKLGWERYKKLVK